MYLQARVLPVKSWYDACMPLPSTLLQPMQAQCDLTNSDSDEVREIPPITEYELRFTHREENPSSSFDSAASNVDDGADPSAPSSVTEDSMDRFLHGCRPPSLPSVPSSPRDSE